MIIDELSSLPLPVQSTDELPIERGELAYKIAYDDLVGDDIASIKSDVTSLQNTDSKIESSIAIIVNGNTTSTTISAGQYVYIKGSTILAEGLYTANSAVPSGTTVSATYFTAVSGGGLNAIQQSMATANEWVLLCDTWLHENGTYTAHYTIDQVDEIAFVYIYGDAIRQSFAVPQSAIKRYNNKAFPDIYFAASRIYYIFELNSTTITISSYTNTIGGGWLIYCKRKPNVV